ncbi:phage tail protein [Escherichia coli]|nr:phage tail protein [Escherichia coli]QLW52969.1 phage tail protein [Escherichia marmotae]
MCADKVKNIVVLSSDISAPLIADLQYFELYSTEALNRKMKNIVLPGVYCGFEPVPGDGLFVRITSEKTEGRGAASVDVGKCQISVQQVSDVVVPVEAGVTTIIVLEANYEHGVKTSQVDSSSDISAARIIALVDEDIAPNQIELCRVIVPDNAQAVTSDMISTKYRANRAVGVEFSSALDSDEEYKAATPLAISTLNKLKAPVDSPEFIGIPKSPTPEQGTNSTQIANAAFVQAAITALIDGSPSALDTLKKIADAINNDPQFSQTINGALALKAPLLSPAFTGVPTAPTASQGTNNTQIANTAFVKAAITALINGAPGTLDTLKEIAAAINNDPNFSTTINNALALKAPLASPALTGVPTAPTAAQGTNNTQIATTAYVRAAISALVGSSPEALDTLNELAAALGNDPNFATTMTNALAGKQPLDATLTALAGLATAANKLPYFTGKDTVALADLTSVGRNILAKTSVLAVIQYLGLRELGTSGEKIPLLSTANTWSERQTFNGGITGSLTGNADTATKLKTARKINNVSFDGSSDITLTASDVEALPLEDARKIIQPLPDVWIPFNDSLDMITGFAPGYKSITVGDDVITLPSEKVVSFTRASTATYIDKSGCFAEAAINEPRFEKDGLLIEGQRTNTFSYTNTPASWNYDTANLTITTGVDEYGFSYGLFGVKETSTTERATLISTGYTRVISVSANESVTLSCRVKKVSGDGIITLRPRISYVNDDGSSNTLTAGAYIDCETGDMLSYSGDEAVTYNIFRESNGWIRVEFTYKSPEAKNMYGRFEFGAHQRSIKSGDELMLTTPQFEKGLNASSFIITTDVGATRASDQVIIPIPFNWATPPISVLMEVNVNWDSEMPNLEGSARLLNISITGATTEVSDESYMYFGFTTRGQRLIITNGKGTKTEYKAYGNREKRKFVAGFKFTEEKQLQVVVDGVLGSSSLSLHTLQRYTAGNINIGGQSSSGNRHLFGHVKNLRIWHKALTDQQMAEVIE